LTTHGEILVYQTDDGAVRLDVRLQDETVWLTQAMMAELFGTAVPNVRMQLRSIFEEGELAPTATVQKLLTVRQEGTRTVQREVDHYNLDAVISVGYRVKSTVATPVTDYFDGLLERIRDIRASERRSYLRVREIFSMAAAELIRSRASTTPRIRRDGGIPGGILDV